MKLLIITHKEVWRRKTDQRFITNGGFPIQINALSKLFEKTTLLIPKVTKENFDGAIPLEGKNIDVKELSKLIGRGKLRKLFFPFWVLRNLTVIMKEYFSADAIHALVPGDVGFFGGVLAVLLGKHVFIRHCATWGKPYTSADKLLFSFLESQAGGKTIVFATGIGVEKPSLSNPNIKWIYSTSLNANELQKLSTNKVLLKKDLIHLISVGRLVESKNFQSTLNAVKILHNKGYEVLFDVVGSGDYFEVLKNKSESLGIAESVRFHGNLTHENVLELLSNANIFIFPTTTAEGFPKAVLEAIACGLPVVASNISSIEILLKTGAGIVLENTDPNTIADAILSIYLDQSKFLEMSCEGRNRAKDYSVETWSDRIKEELENNWNIPLK